MASRFGIVDEEGIDELKELSENENTKKSTEQCKNVFVKWATDRGKEKNLEAYECIDLDKTFCRGSQKKRRRLRARFTQSHACSLGATLKIVPEIYYQR